jgi:hypothetical protein
MAQLLTLTDLEGSAAVERYGLKRRQTGYDGLKRVGAVFPDRGIEASGPRGASNDIPKGLCPHLKERTGARHNRLQLDFDLKQILSIAKIDWTDLHNIGGSQARSIQAAFLIEERVFFC